MAQNWFQGSELVRDDVIDELLLHRLLQRVGHLELGLPNRSSAKPTKSPLPVSLPVPPPVPLPVPLPASLPVSLTAPLRLTSLKKETVGAF